MIKNYLLKIVNKYVKEYFENINDMEYGLLKGEVKMKKIFFKENALKKFTSLLLKNSKIEEIEVKYGWSIFGENSVHIKAHNVLLNLHYGGSKDEKSPTVDMENTKITIEIHKIVINIEQITLKVSNITFLITEFPYRKVLQCKDITIYINSKKVFYIPTVEGDVNMKEITTLNILIKIIRLKLDAKILTVLKKYDKYFLKETKLDKPNNIQLIGNIRSIIIDFTDARKRICLDTTSLMVTNKLKFWIEKIRGVDIRYKNKIVSGIRNLKPRKLLYISKLSLNSHVYIFERLFIDYIIVKLFLSCYSSIINSYQTIRTGLPEDLTVILKNAKFSIDDIRVIASNCLLERCVSPELSNSFKAKIVSLSIDKFLKAENLRIGIEDKKVHTETGDVFVNLERVDLKKMYRLYSKYCLGDGTLGIDFENYLGNLKIVYGSKTKLIEVDNIILSYNLSNCTIKIPLFFMTSDSKCIFEVYKFKKNIVCCLSDFFIDLKMLKKFNNEFLLPREDDINYIIKHFMHINKTGKCLTSIYLYNANIIYEDLRLNINFFEHNKIINTIFSVILDDGDHIIVDNAKVKVLLEDILQFYITHNVRINITNNIFKKLHKLFLDIRNIIILSIKYENTNESFICWILDVKSVSLNIFDRNLNEIAAIYFLDTKICNLQEHDGDETVRKFYFKIDEIQIDNQIMKNTYPVILHKTKANNIIEGNVLYYYNSSTIFIKSTVVKFEEIRLNVEGKHFNKILEVFKMNENIDLNMLNTNIESFMTTCVTVKDFHIGEFDAKINYLMSGGDNIREKMLFFVMNNISDFNLAVDKLYIKHHRTDVKGLFDIVYNFYKSEIYNNLFKVVGHIDMLGNVGALTNTISGTIKDNVKKKTGFFKGSKILLKNTLMGVTNTIGKISSSLKNNAGLLTFDKEFIDASEYHPYAYDIHLPLSFRHNQTQLNLLMKGTEKFVSSVYSGMLGVAKKPFDGSGNGVGGVIIGLGKGMIGAISKPVVGASELVSNCVQFIGGGPVMIRRIMYPMYTVDKIERFNIDQAASFYIFISFLNKIEGEEFIDGSFGHFGNVCLLILTNLRLIITTETSVYEIDPYEIHLDSREMNRFVVDKEEVVAYRREFVKSLCANLMNFK